MAMGEECGFVLLALPAFLLSVISTFFPQNKEWGPGRWAPTSDSPLELYLKIEKMFSPSASGRWKQRMTRNIFLGWKKVLGGSSFWPGCCKRKPPSKHTIWISGELNFFFFSVGRDRDIQMCCCYRGHQFVWLRCLLRGNPSWNWIWHWICRTIWHIQFRIPPENLFANISR